jgi:hypothetical protein
MAVLPLVLTAVVYAPIVGAYFRTDDFLNLYNIANLDPVTYLVTPHGGHILVTRNAVFHFFRDAFGLSPSRWYWAVLATHLLNVHLLFRIVRRVTASAHLATFSAALWGMCPVHAGTLSWYSVYGQVLVGTLLLCLLAQATRIASDDRDVPAWASVLWPVLLLLASTSFGVGLGLTMVAPLVLYLILPPTAGRGTICAALALLALLLPVLYFGLLALHGHMSGVTDERAKVAILLAGLQYVGRILAMTAFLMGYGLTSLLAGFAARPPIPGPFVLAVTASVLALGLVALARARGVDRRRLAAFLLLAVGCYGTIAAGRAVFFDMGTLIYGVRESRYHYVGTIPLAVAIGLMLAWLGRSLPEGRGLRYALLGGWVAATLALYAVTPPFIDLNDNARAETGRVLAAIRSAVAVAPPGTDVRISNRPFLSIGPMMIRDPSFPGWAGVFTIFFPSNVVDGRRVYFVVDDPKVLAAASHGRRTSGLLVPPAPGDQPAAGGGAADGGASH